MSTISPTLAGLRSSHDTLVRLGFFFVREAMHDLWGRPLPPLLRSGVVYRREASGHERWLLPHEVMARGAGDCEDLAAWLAAELRLKGVPAEFAVVASGPGRWHAVVKMPDGRIADPSRLLLAAEARRKKKG